MNLPLPPWGYGLTGNQTLLVLDMGGGTLDWSLVELTTPEKRPPMGFILKWGRKHMAHDTAQIPKTAKVLAKAGENLGGADIDNWLVDYFQQQQEIEGSPVVQRLVERLKIQLSQQEWLRRFILMMKPWKPMSLSLIGTSSSKF